MKPAIASRELLDHPPPADVEAEKMALGSILISAIPDETFATVSERLQPRDFYDDANRTVFETMKRLRQNNMPIDVKLLCDSLKSATAHDICAYEEVGGPVYILSLAKSVPNAAHARYYASIVRECADKRRLFDFAIQTAQAAHNGKPVADIVSTLRETLDDFERRDVVSSTPSIVTIGKLVADNPSLADPVIDGLLSAARQ